MYLNHGKRDCPICNCKHNDIIFTRDFSVLGELVPFEKYDVVICEKCGFAYAKPYELFNLDKYYSEM